MKIKDITHFLETIAPTVYQESYDNAGLITGNPMDEVTSVLVTLDVTEEVIDEAIKRDCNLIVAHHPIIFQGLKKLTGRNYVERTVIQAIKNDVAIYAIHTNLDNVKNGVNAKICEKIGIQDPQILAPKSEILQKLTVFVPSENANQLRGALGKAGAGNMGDYSDCIFSVTGEGTFRPNDKANPHIGEAQKLEKVTEERIEVIFPKYLQGRVLSAMQKVHPYEEVAYFLHALENKNPYVGSGMIGKLAEPMDEIAFFKHLKTSMNLTAFKHTTLRHKPIEKVAVCGGAGGFLLRNAISAGADIFITSDYKYHEFFDAENRIIIADIGHYESEIFTNNLLADFLTSKFENLAVKLVETNTNPVQYFIG